MVNSSASIRKSLAAPPHFNPRSVPISHRCEDQTRVSDHLFNANVLRQRFASPPAWTPEITDENRHVIASNIIAQREAEGLTTEAAILLPIVMQSNGLHVLLTQRTEHLHDHAGQISFPGGRKDFADESIITTALRESEEEIGLPSDHIDVIGTMPEYLTVSGYRVTPVVALVAPPQAYRPDPFEVADVFEVPLSFLMNPANHEVRVWHSDEGSRRFYAIPYADRFIWGATAGMLRNLYHLLKA
ncbi:CoA pyrophosphatase [Polynucleobacter sp. MWH-UH24A]|jgi:8-oxo-dGTP pyrophosphatase MutT (NUDIX family)|uniref:CoA pyrophosphatase n=1 Tax=Polynucleobacter sp. MWH-UH24A TaxID=2689110 RepID=UPI000116005D|nr:CoA pyrophosphatase [Polynucleobacter sp. MWH-UH24A]NCX40178.1 CoA pyrophosphatase [Burkholderiaceae bacterium]QWD76547.1 CoA pyrophosphatase [Polynucleobacter sp. MWH-UH24A]